MWRANSPLKRISDRKAALFASIPGAHCVLCARVGLSGTPWRTVGICQQNLAPTYPERCLDMVQWYNPLVLNFW